MLFDIFLPLEDHSGRVSYEHGRKEWLLCTSLITF